MHETQFGAEPYDVDLTPNGLIAVVRGRSSAVSATISSNDRVSFWRTDVTSNPQIFPNQATVGRGNPITSGVGGYAPGTFSNAIAVNNERAVVIGSADSNGDFIEDATFVDIVAFNYTQSPPTVSVLSSTALGGGTNAGAIAGLAHDVAITPDGVLAVVSHRNWIHVFELMTGTVVAGFNVGAGASPAGAGPCTPSLARNSLEVTNEHAVITMARSLPVVPPASSTWVYVVDLSYSPPATLPTLVLEHEPFASQVGERKPHDLAISPNGTLAGISSWGMFALNDLSSQSPAFVGGQFDSSLWKERDVNNCFTLWDSIEMSNERAVLLSDRALIWPQYPCGFKFRWVAQVFSISTTAATQLALFDDTDIFDPASPTYFGNPAWDLTLSDDGTIAALNNTASDVALVGVDTQAPSLVRLGGLGAPLGSPAPDAPGAPPNPAYRNNDSVVITRGYTSPSLPGGPQPGTHRWIAFLHWGMPPGPTQSFLYLYDLPRYLTVPPTPTFHIADHSDPGNDTWGAELELNASQTEVLVRNTAPPDEQDPAAGGRDWYRYNSQNSQGTPPFLVGSPFGGKGYCIGVDNLVQRRGVVVSISANASLANTGFVHVVRTF